MRNAANRVAYEACGARRFGLPHKFVTFYWDKFGTGRRDVPFEACKFCRKLKP